MSRRKRPVPADPTLIILSAAKESAASSAFANTGSPNCVIAACATRGKAQKEDCRRRTQQVSDDIADWHPVAARCSQAPTQQLEFVPQSRSARMDGLRDKLCRAEQKRRNRNKRPASPERCLAWRSSPTQKGERCFIGSAVRRRCEDGRPNASSQSTTWRPKPVSRICA
jgi:hypothetical protein